MLDTSPFEQSSQAVQSFVGRCIYMNFGFGDHLSRRGGELTTRPSQIKYHASEIMDGSFRVLSIRVERRHVGANRTRAWFVAARLCRKRSTLGETLRPAAKPPHPACGVSQTRVVLASEIKSDADVFREVSATLVYLLPINGPQPSVSFAATASTQ